MVLLNDGNGNKGLMGHGGGADVGLWGSVEAAFHCPQQLGCCRQDFHISIKQLKFS